MTRLLSLGLLALTATGGCTTSGVGQVVTNVGSDGQRRAIIEKGTLKQRKCLWTYVTEIWVEDFKTTKVQLGGS